MSPELDKAIKERKNLGYSEDQIKQELIEAGYQDSDIALVLDQTNVSSDDSALMPGVMTLVNNAVGFVKERYDLALIMASPLIVVSLVDYLTGEAVLSGGLLVVTGIVSLLSLIAYYVLSLSVLYVVAHQEDREIDFREALSWSGHNIFKYAWLAILSALVVWGGFLLLIVPGIIFSIYFYFAQFVFVVEGKTGFAAMARSQQMVTGAWWPLVGRLFGVSALLLLFFILMGLLVGLATISLSENVIALFLTDVVLQLFFALVTVGGFHIVGQLYKNRQQQVPAGGEIKPKSALYGIFIAIGLLLIPIIITAVVMFSDQINQELLIDGFDYQTEQELLEAKNRAQEIRNIEESSAI